MAESAADGLVKLQLDAETGEMVSKKELKKRLQKREKRAAAQNKSKSATREIPPPADKFSSLDPDSIFKHGFLADVFNERPSEAPKTRFPPEPNGFLHLGHAKAIAINFGFAKYHGGETNLRFDDTNPDAEEARYFEAIDDMVRWLGRFLRTIYSSHVNPILGFTPHRITYSSDNFQRLYELAQELIRLDKAYVCQCSEAEIKRQRGGEEGRSERYRCEHAFQDVETSLNKFLDMHQGKFEPRSAFLRMRQDILGSGNPQMWDIVAYRIPKDRKPHHRTGHQWVAYPTYDFAHGLCDSIEGITHSLCTTEFVTARESYEWLNKTLGVYEPMQREFGEILAISRHNLADGITGRLNVSGTVMSKRALKQLVDLNLVRGWDDPRLYTLIAIRRRGVPPGAILSFINELGVTTAKTTIQTVRFEQSVRRYLEATVPRLMLVLDPVPVVILDIGKLEGQELEFPLLPKVPDSGSYRLSMTATVYIDRSDFREVPHEDFFRLMPGQSVGLLQVPYPIKVVSFSKDETTGQVTEIQAEFDKGGLKPKSYIHWVPSGSRAVTARMYRPLFKSPDPMVADGGFLNDINPASEIVHSAALINSGFDEVRRAAPWPKVDAGTISSGPADVRFQAMRVGYFVS